MKTSNSWVQKELYTFVDEEDISGSLPDFMQPLDMIGQSPDKMVPTEGYSDFYHSQNFFKLNATSYLIPHDNFANKK